MQTISIRLPIPFFASFLRVCSTFIWRSKPLRIKFSCLTLPKIKGGIAFPDLHRYYYASNLARTVNWNIHQSVKDWVTLERIITPYCMRSLPWIHPNHLSNMTKSHPLIGSTLEVFWSITQLSNPMSWLSPLTPLHANTDFVPGIEESFLSTIWPHKDVLDSHILRRGYLIYLKALNNELAPYSISQWTYMQIKHFLTRQETFMDEAPQSLRNPMLQKNPQRHLILFYTHHSLGKPLLQWIMPSLGT